MSERKLTRRDFLHMSAALAVGVAAAACASPATEAPPPTQQAAAPTATTKPADTPVPKSKYSEAPMLAELVKAGKLPPVDERLPEEPLVIQPVERIGKHGGTWKSAVEGGGDQGIMTRTIFYNGMVHWEKDGDIVPHVAKGWQFNEDQSQITFFLRKGMKWSDGEPYTADDILFYVNDMQGNADYSPGGPAAEFVVNGEPGVFEKVDDYTIKCTFAAPYGYFLNNLGRYHTDMTERPSHYLKQFHAKYNDNVEALVKAAEADSWVALLGEKSSGDQRWRSTEVPYISGWVCTAPYVGDATLATFERNPYFWAVDPEGNQLPYIDKVEFKRYEDEQVLIMACVNGEFNYYGRNTGGFANKPLYVENADKAGYRLIPVLTSSSTIFSFEFSWCHKDPEWRSLMTNKDFRIGMSLALDREEVNEALYAGEAPPNQCAPRPESPFYDEEFAKQYTEYDVEKAAEHLEKAGCTRDASGMWLRPNGEPLKFTVLTEGWLDDIEIYVSHWQKFGIDCTFQKIERQLIHERSQVGDFEIIGQNAVGGIDIYLVSSMYLPYNDWNSRYAMPWAMWRTSGGLEGEEPPDFVKRQFELWDKLHITGDAALQKEYMWEILEIAKEQFYVMGTNLRPNEFCVVANSFRNVPDEMTGSWPGQARSRPVQFFIDPDM